jgi:hypothetical protein
MGARGIVLSVLPHPGPLPLGEGETDAAAGLNGCVEYANRGRADSLSQRERAGVRENGQPTHDSSDVFRMTRAV